MSPSFHDLAPVAGPWIESLREVPLIHQANETAWVFAAIETGHLLSLAVLGGSVLALDLRLLGLALKEETTAEVERRTRPWLHVGVAGALTTGVAMAVLNANGLFPSVAFLVKMIALLAAILFSYGVVRPVVRTPERVRPGTIAGAVAAVLIWALALLVFAVTPGVNPGVVLIVVAGAALLGAAARRHRKLLLAGLGGLLIAGWAVTHLVLSPGEGSSAVALANVGFVAAAALLALGVGGLEVRAQAAAGEQTNLKLAAFASTLAWVTVAAAGRWIGFS